MAIEVDDNATDFTPPGWTGIFEARDLVVCRDYVREYGETVFPQGNTVDTAGDWLTYKRFLEGTITEFVDNSLNAMPDGKNCFICDQQNLELLSLPSLTNTASGFLSGCTSLKKFDLQSFTKLERDAFYNCQKLQFANFPSLTRFVGFIFADAKSMRAFKAPFACEFSQQNTQFRNTMVQSIIIRTEGVLGSATYLGADMSHLCYLICNNLHRINGSEDVYIPTLNTTEHRDYHLYKYGLIWMPTGNAMEAAKADTNWSYHIDRLVPYKQEESIARIIDKSDYDYMDEGYTVMLPRIIFGYDAGSYYSDTFFTSSFANLGFVPGQTYTVNFLGGEYDVACGGTTSDPTFDFDLYDKYLTGNTKIGHIKISKSEIKVTFESGVSCLPENISSCKYHFLLGIYQKN